MKKSLIMYVRNNDYYVNLNIVLALNNFEYYIFILAVFFALLNLHDFVSDKFIIQIIGLYQVKLKNNVILYFLSCTTNIVSFGSHNIMRSVLGMETTQGNLC